jgi:transposase, IS30 family
MRDRRRTPAGGVQAEKQQRYVQLIAQGVSNAEACRLVGINRRTGTRWRYGRRVRNSGGDVVNYPAVKITKVRPRSPRYLSEPERIRIADLRSAGATVRGIASALGRAPSTISREIRRNSDPDGRYRPHHAEHVARMRACKPRTRRIAGDAVLAEASRACWAGTGARSRSRTSCGSCSPVSRGGGCARNRSTRRSMTRRCR